MKAFNSKLGTGSFALLFILGSVGLGCGNFEAEKSNAVEADTEKERWVLSVVDSNTVSLPKGTTEEIKVQLADPGEGVVSEETVVFKVPGDKSGSSSLAERRATTNADGIASVTFRAGLDLETVAVRADHYRADGVDIYVEVTEPADGSLRVEFAEPRRDGGDLHTTQVGLHPSHEFSCSTFDPLAEREEAPRNQIAADPSKRVTFSELDPESTYTVAVRAENRTGLRAAAGCRDGVEIPAGAEGETTIDLSYLPLDPSGTYDLASTWDLTSFVEAEELFGESTANLIDFAADPTQALFDSFTDKLEEWTSRTVALAVEHSSIAADIKGAIDDRLRENGLPEKLRNSASSFRETIKGLEIRGRLEVSERKRDAKITGSQVWETAHVQPSEDCSSDDPACRQYAIELQSDVEGGLAASWEGRIEGYNELVMNEHTIRIDAGDLATQILEKVVLPRLTDGAATTFEEAIHYWFDCDELAGNISEKGTLCVSEHCIPESTVASACNAMVDTSIDTEKFVDGLLDVTVAFEVEGDATMTTRNARDEVETIERGSFGGSIRTIGNHTTAPAEARWSAARK